MKILIAEDTEDSRILLEMTLASQGHEVISSSNGIEALNLARSTPPDLIISDIMMPEMDGFELCRQVKTDPELQKIPFIFYTSTYTEPNDEELARLLGGSRFLIKPLEPQELMKTIEEVLAEHEEATQPMPEEALKPKAELDEMYSRSVGDKLDKKVRELEQEREALRESEERIRQVVETVPDILYTASPPDFNATYISPAIERLLGFTPEEWLADPERWAKQMHNEDREQTLSIIGEAYEKKESFVFEYRLWHKDGKTFRWFEDRASWESDSGGNALALQGIMTDITERKRAEDMEKRLIHDLGERVKELTVLHRTATILQNESLTIPEILKEIAVSLPSAWQYPECTEVRITYGDDSFETPGFSETQWGLKAGLATLDGKNCMIEIVYLEERPLEADGPFLAEERNLINSIVEMMRASVERKRAEVSLERLNRALRTLSATNAALIHVTDEQQLLNDICELIVKTSNYRMVWVGYLEGDDEQRLVPVAKAGHVEGYLELLPDACFVPTEVDAVCCPSALCILTRSTAVANDIQTNPQYAAWNKQAMQFGFESTISLPLDLRTSGRGVLNIYAAEANAFHDEEIALLTELTADLAFGIQTVRLRLEHDQSSEKLQNALVQAIQAIANTVEQRDPYTAGHQRRVAELAVAIARDMGLDEGHIKGIRMGATIHDIGKVYVPAEILNRPGKLSDYEFGIIQSHAAVGYDIIKGVEFPWPVAKMIRQHHERMDGSGYPDGLKGDAILLEARILAVADVVEAIASHRPYRPALGIDAALKEIQKNRSRFYDAEVVDSCIKLFESKTFAWKM
ncbi:MAG: HD domain-containing protein [Gammaproteobacteria bacterium]|nr:HD domain-containing protein [Gammaproteobacteria bacterium]